MDTTKTRERTKYPPYFVTPCNQIHCFSILLLSGLVTALCSSTCWSASWWRWRCLAYPLMIFIQPSRWRRGSGNCRWENDLDDNTDDDNPDKILADLPVTGVIDDEVLKMVEKNTCPVKGQSALIKQNVGVSGGGCVCNGRLDYKGNGQCRTTFQGHRWCYVEHTSGCRDKRWTGGTWWSWAACSRRWLWYL